MHPMFKYPPIHETLVDNNDPANKQSQDILPQVPLASPDTMTSKTELISHILPLKTLQERSWNMPRMQTFRH